MVVEMSAGKVEIDMASRWCGCVCMATREGRVQENAVAAGSVAAIVLVAFLVRKGNQRRARCAVQNERTL